MVLALPEVLDLLATVYGEPEKAPLRTLFELVLLENVAYLVDDARRTAAFEALAQGIGMSPKRIAAASDAQLEAVAGHGILAANQADKLRTIARLVLEHFDGDLDPAVRPLPLREAKHALMRFPSIGEPGSEKILLFGRCQAVLGLESNGVRALTRLGLVAEARSYTATYRNVQQYVAQFAQRGFDWLVRAHQLLRQHGQELCRRSTPRCQQCPLTDTCAFYAERVAT